MHTAVGWSSCWTEAEVTWMRPTRTVVHILHQSRSCFHEFRKSHDVGYYLEYNLLQKYEGLLPVLGITWMFIKLLSTFLIFGVSCSNLAQAAEFCLLALQWRYWWGNPRRASENLCALFLWEKDVSRDHSAAGLLKYNYFFLVFKG